MSRSNAGSAAAWQTYTLRCLVVLIAWIVLAATSAVLKAHLFFQQPGAARYPAQLACILAVYAAGIVLFSRSNSERGMAVPRIALTFGIASALVETTGVVLENVTPQLFRYPAASISLMSASFLLWAVASVRAYGDSASYRCAFTAAVGSAGICMLIAVAVGLPVELFLQPTDPTAVATWGEYRRSGWTNPGLFALANTLDSAFTHLLLAPLVACIFGGTALLLRRTVSAFRQM